MNYIRFCVSLTLISVISLSKMLSADTFETVPSYVQHVPHPGFWIKDSDGVCATQSWDACQNAQAKWQYANRGASYQTTVSKLNDMVYGHIWNFDTRQDALRLDDPQSHRKAIALLESEYLHKDFSQMSATDVHVMIKKIHRALSPEGTWVQGYRSAGQDAAVSLIDGPNPVYHGDMTGWFAENDPVRLPIWQGIWRKVLEKHLYGENGISVASMKQGLEDAGLLTDDEAEIFAKYFFLPPRGGQVTAAMDAYVEEVLARLADVESDPFETAAYVHQGLVRVHPFRGDGHGRTARLLMNLILMQAGHYPVVFFSEEAYTKAVTAVDARVFVEFLREESDHFAFAACEYLMVNDDDDAYELEILSEVIEDPASFENRWGAHGVIEHQVARQQAIVDSLNQRYSN